MSCDLGVPELEGRRLVRRVQDNAQATRLRHDLKQEVENFSAEIPRKVGRAGDVAAGTRQALDELRADRVGDAYHHDRDRACGTFGGGNGRGAPSDDNAHIRADELYGEVIERLMRVAESRLEAHVLAVHQAVLPQPGLKLLNALGRGGG